MAEHATSGCATTCRTRGLSNSKSTARLDSRGLLKFVSFCPTQERKLAGFLTNTRSGLSSTLVPQLASPDLPGLIAWQGRDDLVAARQLVARQVQPQVGVQLLQRRRCIGVGRLDQSMHAPTQVIVLEPNHRRISHAQKLGQDRLHLSRYDVGAAGNNLVHAPVG